jgi:hypothetical protein
MTRLPRRGLAATTLACLLAACSSGMHANQPSTTSDAYSGTPMPTSAAPSAATPGTGDMDQGKRVGTHP